MQLQQHQQLSELYRILRERELEVGSLRAENDRLNNLLSLRGTNRIAEPTQFARLSGLSAASVDSAERWCECKCSAQLGATRAELEMSQQLVTQLIREKQSIERKYYLSMGGGSMSQQPQMSGGGPASGQFELGNDGQLAAEHMQRLRAQQRVEQGGYRQQPDHGKLDHSAVHTLSEVAFKARQNERQHERQPERQHERQHEREP